MYEDKLDGLITTEMYNEKSNQYRSRMDELFSVIDRHESVDPSELVKSVDLLELVRNARRMYLQRESKEKRRLVKNLLSNCSWKNGRLFAEFWQPYKL